MSDLVQAYRHAHGDGNVHGLSIGKAPVGQHRTRCGLMVAGIVYSGSFREVTCKKCQQVMTGVRRPNAQPVEQLSLLDV